MSSTGAESDRHLAAHVDPRLATVVALADAAGQTLLSRFRNSGDLDIAFKGPRDLVTIADRNSESLIIDGLRSEFPGHAILAEESGGSRGVDPAEPTWIVDPLDGTTNFAHGHPMFAISIGLWRNGRAELGVVHAPALRETFAATRGGGTIWSQDGNGFVPVSVSEHCQLRDVVLATGFSYERREIESGGLDAFAALLAAARGMRRSGSAALDLAYTAAGILGGYWEYYLQPHDVAAGALLVTEAGGRVTDVAGGDDYLQGGSIVAANPTLHDRIRQLLAAGPEHPGLGRQEYL
ncbi:MAG: inositol monophosphatase family protein [Planctomycetota bacterium]